MSHVSFYVAVQQWCGVSTQRGHLGCKFLPDIAEDIWGTEHPLACELISVHGDERLRMVLSPL